MIGNSTGPILPEALVDRLNLAQGARLHATVNVDGSGLSVPLRPSLRKGHGDRREGDEDLPQRAR